MFPTLRALTLPPIAQAADSTHLNARTGRSSSADHFADGSNAIRNCCSSAVIVAGSAGAQLKVAGLSVLDRLVISLSRAGINHIVAVGAVPGSLPRSTALGLRVERSESMPELAGPLLCAQGNVLASVGDLRRVLESSARLASSDGERLPLGMVEGASDDWLSRVDRAPLVKAEGPAGIVTDEESARRIERAYWSSLMSSSDGWVDRRFNRPLGRWLSLALVDTRVTPNQVSVGAILLGLTAAALLALGTWWTAVWGALVLQLSAIVDCVDGDLARAQCRESALGKWLDVVGDQVVHLGIFLGLGIGLSRAGEGGPVLTLGIIAAAGVLLSFLVVLRVLLKPALRGHGRIQRLIDATTNRDFSVLLILFALGGVLDLFLWMAAMGSHLFWIVALTLQIQDREPASDHEQVP